MLGEYNLVPLTFKVTGTTPLLMCNERLANKLDPLVKEIATITGKRAKTDEDLQRLGFLEFKGGLYLDESGVYIPESWISGIMREGGKEFKLGKKVTQGVFVAEDKFYLNYGGKAPSDKTVDGWTSFLWESGYYDFRAVVCNGSRIFKYRPRFDTWKFTFSIYYDSQMFDKLQICNILEVGGARKAFGTYRPKFGRCIIEEDK